MNPQENGHDCQRELGSVRTTVLICTVLIVAGALLLALIFSTEPVAKRESAVRETAMLVEVTQAEVGSFRPLIEAMGVVRPAREIVLRPRVGGEVASLADAFVPGGFVSRDDVLVRIDDADYRNALQQRESELEQAIAELEIERGRQDLAADDYRELGRTLTPDKEALVLRQPQLRSAEALVAAARTAVERARLDLQRTTVRAPFEAQVLSREANLGSQVAVGDPLARLVGVETYWVEASIPLERLRWLTFGEDQPERGSGVTIRHRTAWPSGQTRSGNLFRLIGELEGDTRMARVLVAVHDPLARGPGDPERPPLMIGTFVECRIQGLAIEDALRLSRQHIRKDDTVWLMRDDRLVIQPVDIVFRDAEYAYIRGGLEAADRVITTSLATVQEGARLRLKSPAGDAGEATTDAGPAQ